MSEAIELLRDCLEKLKFESCSKDLAGKVSYYLENYEEKPHICQCGECQKHKEKYFNNVPRGTIQIGERKEWMKKKNFYLNIQNN